MKKFRVITGPDPQRPKSGFTREEIEEAIQRLAKRGLIVDSGKRRWSERTGRYEIVWISKTYEGAN
jgi:hypothetical protein